VWPASMGGRLRSRSICCDGCNNFISTKEFVLLGALRHAFASVGAVNDRGEPVMVLIERDGHEFAYADGNALLQVPGVTFNPATKSVIVPLPAGLDEQARKVARSMWSHGLTADDVDRFNIEPGGQGPVLPDGPTGDEYDLSVGRRIEHRQVFIKMALELLAFHRHDLAMKDELSPARRFARYGDSGEYRVHFDTRSRGSGLIAADGLPEVLNAVEVWTAGTSVLFRAVFLGPIVFTGSLTSDWLSESFRTAYAFDARDPARTIASAFDEQPGRPLATWFIRNEIEHSNATLEAISGRLALERSKTKPQREPPPDVDVLRAAIRAQLSTMPPRKKRR